MYENRTKIDRYNARGSACGALYNITREKKDSQPGETQQWEDSSKTQKQLVFVDKVLQQPPDALLSYSGQRCCGEKDISTDKYQPLISLFIAADDQKGTFRVIIVIVIIIKNILEDMK